MKDDLAEQLLVKVMGWGPEEVPRYLPSLQALARHKYDEYEGYRPGEKFIESLSAWLWQFEPAERQIALDFVLNDLVFISRAEMDHLIETVYPDIIRPLLVRQTAVALGTPPHLVRQITQHPEFGFMQRRTLILGLADGARLDRLRRASPELSHEQFYVAPELSEGSTTRMREKLAQALANAPTDVPRQFQHIILVDDFSGSGFTLLHQDGASWGGKLWRAHGHLRELADGPSPTVADDANVWVVLYVVSEQARRSLEENLSLSGLGWHLRVVQEIPGRSRVTDSELVAMCRRYFDRHLLDDHMRKGSGDGSLGFDDGAQPLVLHHNAPNNSVSLIWADSRGIPGALQRRSLFPRRRRHTADKL